MNLQKNAGNLGNGEEKVKKVTWKGVQDFQITTLNTEFKVSGVFKVSSEFQTRWEAGELRGCTGTLSVKCRRQFEAERLVSM